MHRFFIKTPRLVKYFYSDYVWSLPILENKIYITFDDGPHPQITPFVLEELNKFKAKATFFCIGNNVVRYPDVYQQIIKEGHSIGNHTQNHKNGWKVSDSEYLADVAAAAKYIDTNLFRPPYGRITRRQARNIPGAMNKAQAKIIMWDVLSADFDVTIKPEACSNNVLKNTEKGSIIVFHDSEKAAKNMQYALPRLLAWATEKRLKCCNLLL